MTILEVLKDCLRVVLLLSNLFSIVSIEDDSGFEAILQLQDLKRFFRLYRSQRCRIVFVVSFGQL